MEDHADSALRGAIARAHLGVLATIKRDGRPQLSNVTHFYDMEHDTIRISVTDTRAKTKNVRRDPRVSYHVAGQDGWSYAVVEGTAELSDVTTDPRDKAADELVELYRSIQGEHPDWAEYRAAMVEQQRLVLRLRVQRVYGTAG